MDFRNRRYFLIRRSGDTYAIQYLKEFFEERCPNCKVKMHCNNYFHKAYGEFNYLVSVVYNNDLADMYHYFDLRKIEYAEITKNSYIYQVYHRRRTMIYISEDKNCDLYNSNDNIIKKFKAKRKQLENELENFDEKVQNYYLSKFISTDLKNIRYNIRCALQTIENYNVIKLPISMEHLKADVENCLNDINSLCEAFDI